MNEQYFQCINSVLSLVHRPRHIDQMCLEKLMHHQYPVQRPMNQANAPLH